MDPLKERIRNWHAGRILDVATGTGGFLKSLADSFGNFTEGVGVDPAVDRIETAGKAADKRLRFEVMDAEELAFADRFFDTVVMRHSLHHLRHADRVLGEMVRVLKKDGLMIIGEVIQEAATDRPNSERHLHHWWGRVDRTRGVPHFETLTREEVMALTRPLRLAGEEVLEFYEETTKEEQTEALSDMLRHSEEVIRKLREAGDQPELLAQGEKLVDLFRSQGCADEKVLYVLGRKG